MNYESQWAAATARVLSECSDEVNRTAPWRWHVAVQNGTRLSVRTSLAEGFLDLALAPEAAPRGVAELEHALLANSALTGGAGLALHPGAGLQVRAEVALPEDGGAAEKRLPSRVRWAFGGVIDGAKRLKHLDAAMPQQPQLCDADDGLRAMLGAAAWKCEERVPNEFSAALDASGAQPAKIGRTAGGVQFRVELGRVGAEAKLSRAALALFLLTVSSQFRMAHAFAALTAEGGWSFGFRAVLPPEPEPAEIDHALAALSVAHGAAARESSFLLEEAAARRYLAARLFSIGSTTNTTKGECHGESGSYA